MLWRWSSRKERAEEKPGENKKNIFGFLTRYTRAALARFEKPRNKLAKLGDAIAISKSKTTNH